jgi:hypothetical protein
VEAETDFTFAMVSYKGNPNVFTIFQVVASRDVNVKDTYGCEILMLLVPSTNDMPDVVLTISAWGLDKYPIESRIVTFLPGGSWLDNNTIAFCPAVNDAELIKMTDVLAVTI